MENHQQTTAIVKRLQALRTALAAKNVQAVIIPSADPHISEYLPEFWQGRAWLSGFTGSVGTLVVGADFAYLWADSRYWLQAEKELTGTGIALKKMGVDSDFMAFLQEKFSENNTIAVDGAVVSLHEFEQLTQYFVVNTHDFLADIWADRPSLPTAQIYPHDAQFVDLSASEKLAQVREKMRQQQADYHLISTLDDIAWLTNLRGADVPCNPVFLAHCLLGQAQAILYVDEHKLTDDVKKLLEQAGFMVRPYENIAEDLATLTGTLLLDPKKIAQATLQQLPDSMTLIKKTNPSTLLKAIKSSAELNNIREAMRQDGAALCEFFADFEAKIAAGDYPTEVQVHDLLTEARARQAHFIEPSFDSIVGFRGNGAIVHYHAGADCATIAGDGLLLIDSGAQYQNGTTDITRMIGVGTISDDAKRDVTFVLKAHIALAQAVFPEGVSSVVVDAIARQPMWQQGLDYGHGTGHGVGYFLNVHEGPQVIAYSADRSPNRVLKVGMVTSNEPGLYRTDLWGIRIENLLACVPFKSTEFGTFIRFEDLTICPIDTRLILPNLLTDDEKTWLNSYHQKVRNELLDRVQGAAKQWLLERTQAV